MAMEVAKAGFLNQDELQRESEARCYHCLSTFAVEEINRYEAETAHCPRCDRDAVVPSSAATQEQIEQAKAYWFDGSP